MKIDEAVKILRAHNEWRRAPAHLPEDARPAMGDPRKISIAIDTVCDALSQSDDWARALGLADDAAEAIAQADAILRAAGLSTYSEALAALRAEQEWHDRAANGALDPDWDYETLVGSKRRAAITKATRADAKATGDQT